MSYRQCCGSGIIFRLSGSYFSVDFGSGFSFGSFSEIYFDRRKFNFLVEGFGEKL
jgi:hypothetical protein